MINENLIVTKKKSFSAYAAFYQSLKTKADGKSFFFGRIIQQFFFVLFVILYSKHIFVYYFFFSPPMIATPTSFSL